MDRSKHLPVVHKASHSFSTRKHRLRKLTLAFKIHFTAVKTSIKISRNVPKTNIYSVMITRQLSTGKRSRDPPILSSPSWASKMS